ncbi:hypothetical protein J2Z21_001314 [Streptomyces griseochromogenes]|uniref:Uncharacterized protein n=1 Tax=Streptomyces griseochromogenes TaxID=68214 RepID=A0A1B1ATX4_9ACTN|nr:hypothetical protein [Streptomyces griseochromogenes]ANP50007.1 hypothetical protein AVL59_10645 [Streptomyces griseochromogenes]MBP2048390.1 hypothetical protein [Streptomyces griseochromogenes]
MKKLTKRIALTVSSVAVAGVAVLGAGGAASAASLASTHAQRPTVGGVAADYSWDHGVGYLLERGYSCDEVRGWHQDHNGTDSTRHDCDGLFYRDGHFYRWEGEGHGGWKSDRSYLHDGYRHEHDGRGWDHHDLSRDDR